MKVLLIGSGGREHALGWKLAQSSRLTELCSLPGNPGLAGLGPTVEGIGADNVGAVAAFVAAHGADLVVVGPEAPLAAGLVDALARTGVAAFGPTRAAARLESSKAFAKEIMGRAGIPTATWSAFTDPVAASADLHQRQGPYVVKADGLAAGKGVLVTDSRQDAEQWARRCLAGEFGKAGTTVVIEDYLEGPELSVFALCAGTAAVPLAPARDYKRLADGDRGPNTGGMGSYSPVELPAGLVDSVMATVVKPVLEQMSDQGNPYTGFLYVGLALTTEGPKVMEFNCRMGDPEAQVIMPRLGSDLLDLLASAAHGEVAGTEPEWSPDSAVNVVLAASGYPEAPRLDDEISGLGTFDPSQTVVFHAGTRRQGRRVHTAGGRVLSVVGRGPNLADARRNAYEAVGHIKFRGRQYRTDIAAPVDREGTKQ